MKINEKFYIRGNYILKEEVGKDEERVGRFYFRDERKMLERG